MYCTGVSLTLSWKWPRTTQSVMLRHSGEKPFTCKQCDFSCTTAGDIKQHELTRSGEKKFECNQCVYKFSQAGELKRHMLSHNGEKLFNCSEWGYTCSRNDSLKMHILTQSGEQNFLCKQRNYKSALAENLQRHMRSHSGEKLFTCSGCTTKVNTPIISRYFAFALHFLRIWSKAELRCLCDQTRYHNIHGSIEVQVITPMMEQKSGSSTKY